DARTKVDASKHEGDAASSSVKAAITTAVESDARTDADASVPPAAGSVPLHTPPEATRGDPNYALSDEEDNIFVTVRTSCSEPETLRKRHERRAEKKAHTKLESKGSPSLRLSAPHLRGWARELKLADEGLADLQFLPDIDPSWVNPDWSGSAYMSASVQSEQGAASEDGSVIVLSLNGGVLTCGVPGLAER
ncbi:hypothetical protein FRC10_012145, partial [Ceratobasidium sp. 414]